jgi:hypothetical protein
MLAAITPTIEPPLNTMLAATIDPITAESRRYAD